MNIFQRISALKKINEQKEMIETYYHKLKDYYEKNLLGVLIVYGIKDAEADQLGIRRPVDIKDFDRNGHLDTSKVHSRLYKFELDYMESTKEVREQKRVALRLPFYEGSLPSKYNNNSPFFNPCTIFQQAFSKGTNENTWQNNYGIDKYNWYSQVKALKLETQQWIKTIGQKGVLCFKPNTAGRYISMYNDFMPIFLNFKEMNFVIDNDYLEYKWKDIEHFLNSHKEEMNNGYIIERVTLY